MILILGDECDVCLNMVLDWLDNFDASYLIIDNSESILIEELNVSESKFVFSLKGQCVDYDDVRVVFNWRGLKNFKTYLT
jgi:hypothetical protein